MLFPTTRNTLNDCQSQHETRKKERGNLEQLDYFQDLNRVLFSNVVHQAAQETAYCSYSTQPNVLSSGHRRESTRTVLLLSQH